MYNLLTGYHVGTNRATFLMLPRPHTVQPTLRRTFVQGFREIEGIQDFFLIVTRPKNANAFCVQASLETGHIVDTSTTASASPLSLDWDYDVITIEHKITPGITGGWDFLQEFNVLSPNSDWEFDPNKGDAGHVSVSARVIPNRALGLSQHNYQVEHQGGKLIISGKVSGILVPGVVDGLTGGAIGRSLTIFYDVHIRRLKSALPESSHSADFERLLITQRNLSVCVKVENGCPKTINPDRPITDGPELEHPMIIDEYLINQDQAKAYHELKEAMTAGSSSPSRRERGTISFLDTDAFKEMIKRNIPERVLDQPIDKIDGVPEPVRERLKGVTTRDLLDKDLPLLTRRTGLDPETIQDVRRKIFGFSQMRNPQRQQTKSGDKD